MRNLQILCAWLMAISLGDASLAQVRVAGPVAVGTPPGAAGHDYPFFSTNRHLAAEGYVEEEFFIEGEAAPSSVGYGAKTFERNSAAGDAQPFKTRVIVRRPNAERFNGVAVVEWLNVSNRFEADNVWLATQDHLVKSGYAWFGVSAQGLGGVETLKAWSPTRYGSLNIPNEGRMAVEPLSLDIFHQAVTAVRGGAFLGGLSPKTLIATGQSQSAIWLSSYINGGMASDRMVDGFLLVSASGAKVDPAVSVPVLRIVAEGDAASADLKAQQDDAANFRQWEIAGTSHVDRDLRAAREPLQLRDLGASTQAELAPKCANPAIGTTTPARLVLAAGLDGLARWSRGGQALPNAPRLKRGDDGLMRDKAGLVEGGIRLPSMEAPLGLNLGPNEGASACSSQGSFTPYDLATLRRLYPSKSAYLRAVDKSVRKNVRRGFLLRADGETLVRAAK